jgi:hypothetical protein
MVSKLLKSAQRSVVEKQPLLLTQVGEEDAYHPTRLHAQHHTFAELGMKHLVSGGQTGRRTSRLIAGAFPTGGGG